MTSGPLREEQASKGEKDGVGDKMEEQKERRNRREKYGIKKKNNVEMKKVEE